jgi:potassium efflux system protein
MRWHLRWFILIGLPLGLASLAISAHENDAWRDSFGRLLFMAGMLLSAWFLWRVLQPVGGVFYEFIAYRRDGWIDRFDSLCFPMAIGAPIVLGVLAALGYFYTARQLATRLQATLLVLMGALLVGAFLMRWVLIVRRRLAMQQARQRRAAAQAEPPLEGTSPIPPTAESGMDLSTINIQTRRLVQMALVIGSLAGVGFIWGDVLPALSILNKPLWQSTVEVTETITAVDGSMEFRSVPRQEPVNVSHLMLALLMVGMTIVASRNIPGLLEIALLQRLPLEAATRYAITTVSRYCITIVGLILACATLGIRWSMVQWLVAAISVGLGFGLQEIFANFVSGLIILFEKPVRVGDVVTIDGVSGVVSRIRMRATTITNWDRKELIVPNKEFITGRLLNWTLSDQVNRIELNVGVAFGSEVRRVSELLLQIARSQPHVLSDPPPVATFDRFGDSALNFVLRCYLPSLEFRLQTIHELHARIHDTFNAEGIEIAFPRRDLNIRVSQPSMPMFHLPSSALTQPSAS